MNCGTFALEKITRIIKGRERSKQLGELIEEMLAKKKRIDDWLVKNDQADLPATETAKAEMTEEAYSKEFEALWAMFPERDGSKREKRAAFSKFKKMKGLDQIAVKQAIENYRKSPEAKRGFSRDMVRFLKPDFWPLWINPTQAMMQPKEKGHAQQPPQKANPESKAIDEIVGATTGGKRQLYARREDEIH